MGNFCHKSEFGKHKETPYIMATQGPTLEDHGYQNWVNHEPAINPVHEVPTVGRYNNVADPEEVVRVETMPLFNSRRPAVQRTYEQIMKDMRDELISVYRKNDQLSAPLFPIVPTDQKNIRELYVKPNMKHGKIIIDSYNQIFKDERKKIYIVGEAGTGKTSYCQKMVLTWCQVQSKTEGDMSDDEQTMAEFDFLFYISLGQSYADGFMDTDVEDMIKHQVLPIEFHQLLPMVLKNEAVLIILDGLDEWPLECKTSRQVNKGLPARHAIRECTVLTTSRHWKLEAVQLRSTQTDAKIEVFGVSENSSEQLIQTMLDQLNKTTNSKQKMEDFLEELEYRQLKHFQANPVVLKQLVCLWHSGKPLGQTKCVFYCQMMELLLELAMKHLKEDPKVQEKKEEWKKSTIRLPSCFDDHDKCQEFKPLLVGLGRIAFESLLNEDQEYALFYKRSRPEFLGMTMADLFICLNIGIINQVGTIKAAMPNRKVSFLHESFQEFLAALFVATSTDKPKCIQTIQQTCNSQEKCFEMENLITFISGMCSPETTCKLMYHLRPLVDIENDQYSFPMQNLLTNCLQEGWHCSHGNKHLKCKSIILNSPAQELLFQANIHHLKILVIWSPLTTGILECLLQVHTLQKLNVGNLSPTQTFNEENLYHLVKQNAKTLTHLVMYNMTLRSRTKLCSLLQKVPNLSKIGIYYSALSEHLLDSLETINDHRPEIGVEIKLNTILLDTE